MADVNLVGRSPGLNSLAAVGAAEGQAPATPVNGRLANANRSTAPAFRNTREMVNWISSNPNPYQSDPTKDGSGSDMLGDITRDQWDDYLARFRPYEQKTIEMATGKADNLAAIARARNSVAGAYDVSQGTLDRNRSRMGLATANSEEHSALQARNGLSRTAAEVSAMNGARTATANRDSQLLSGNMAVGVKPEIGV